MISLFYDKNDLRHSEKLRDNRFTWLAELGATEISTAAPDAAGFLFGYENGDEFNPARQQPWIFGGISSGVQWVQNA